MKKKEKQEKPEDMIFNPKYSMKKNYAVYTTIFIVGLFLITTFISIGFAALNQNLNVSGQIEYTKRNVTASNVSYDNSFSGVSCSTVQCMIDYLATH